MIEEKKEQMQLFTNIGALCQVGRQGISFLRGAAAMAALPVLEDAWLLTNGEHIEAYGRMADGLPPAASVVDVGGGWIFPGWVDSHTHLVFAASREHEFVDRIRGLTYLEIAQRGGGILNSARRLAETGEDELLDGARRRLSAICRQGTAALEIKSGYGLSVEAELKMLRVIKRLQAESRIDIRATLLAAHALPERWRTDRRGWLKEVTEELIPQVSSEGLASYIDVFCEKNFFTVEEMIEVIEVGQKYGMRPKVHVNQFNSLGGVAASVWRGALSVDHLEVVSDEDIAVLATSSTVATLLPSAPFFLNDHYPPGRRLIDEGVIVALASDYNPGSSPSGNMFFVLSLACIKSKMLPEEAINAATLNGAAALEWSEQYGSIDVGKVASFFVTSPMSSIAYLPYAFGSQQLVQMYVKGEALA